MQGFFDLRETSIEDNGTESVNPKCIMELLTQLTKQNSEMTTLSSNDLCPMPMSTAHAFQRQVTDSSSHLDSVFTENLTSAFV